MFKGCTQDHYSCWKTIFENMTFNCHVMSKEGSNCSWVHSCAMSQLCKTRLANLRTKTALGLKHIKPPQNCSHMYNISAINFFSNAWTSHLLFFCLF